MCFDNRPFNLWVYRNGNNIVWLKAAEVVAFMGYNCEADAIRDHVFAQNTKRWGEINGLYPPVFHPSIPHDWHPDMIFVNIAGFFQLMLHSEFPDKEAFENWVTTDVMPSIFASGVYMSPNQLINNRQIETMMSILKRKDEQIFEMLYKYMDLLPRTRRLYSSHI